MGFDLPTSSWRVKLYQLKDKEWLDRGTGFCNADVVDQRALLIVRNEKDHDEILLSSQVEGNMQYHKQQGTLIVWTDKEEKEMALSFQEPEGCSLICEFLVYVHNNLENQITVFTLKSQGSNDGEGYEFTELIVGPYAPPPDPAMGRLDYVLEAMSMAIRYPDERELTVAFIRENNYVPKLIEVFDMAEDLESLEDLHNLCRIIKALLLLNDNSLYEIMLNDQNIMGIMGILEYDPEFPKYKANHRAYISDQARFNEVVPFTDQNIRNKIKQTFRLQFLKDVALARLLDEYTCSMIATMIYYNQTEIIRYIEEDQEFTSSLFGLYLSPENVEKPSEKSENGTENSEPTTIVTDEQKSATSDSEMNTSQLNGNTMLDKHKGSRDSSSSPPSTKRRKTKSSSKTLKKQRDGVRLLHQVSSIVKALQHQQRYTLYNKLVSRGMLKMVYFALNDTDSGIRVLGTELLVILVEHDATFVDNSSDDLGLRVLIDLFLEEEDVSLKTQAADTLKMQLDMAGASNIVLPVSAPENEDQSLGVQENGKSETDQNNDNDKNGDIEAKALKQERPLVGLVRKNNTSKARIAIQLEGNIYKKWMPLLFKGLIDLTETESTKIINGDKKLSFAERVYYEKLCGILGFCLEQHHPRCQEFVDEKKLWKSVSLLLKWPYRGIQLTAVHCIRRAFSIELTLDMLESGVLREFLKFTINLGNVNNLLHSSCLSALETLLKVTNQTTPSSSQSSIALLSQWINEDSELFGKLMHFKMVSSLVGTCREKVQAESNFTLTSDDETNEHNDKDDTTNRLKRSYEAIDEKKSLRQTLATAGKKLTMTFKKKAKK